MHPAALEVKLPIKNKLSQKGALSNVKYMEILVSQLLLPMLLANITAQHQLASQIDKFLYMDVAISYQKTNFNILPYGLSEQQFWILKFCLQSVAYQKLFSVIKTLFYYIAKTLLKNMLKLNYRISKPQIIQIIIIKLIRISDQQYLVYKIKYKPQHMGVTQQKMIERQQTVLLTSTYSQYSIDSPKKSIYKQRQFNLYDRIIDDMKELNHRGDIIIQTLTTILNRFNVKEKPKIQKLLQQYILAITSCKKYSQQLKKELGYQKENGQDLQKKVKQKLFFYQACEDNKKVYPIISLDIKTQLIEKLKDYLNENKFASKIIYHHKPELKHQNVSIVDMIKKRKQHLLLCQYGKQSFIGYMFNSHTHKYNIFIQNSQRFKDIAQMKCKDNCFKQRCITLGNNQFSINEAGSILFVDFAASFPKLKKINKNQQLYKSITKINFIKNIWIFQIEDQKQ